MDACMLWRFSHGCYVFNGASQEMKRPVPEWKQISIEQVGF
jgi:hypothetical protein